MRFTSDKNKNYFIPIDEILNDRNDNDHIRPKDHNDFDPKKIYYVYWCYCDGSDCEQGEACKYHRGYIFGLGGTH